jgi:hypothetical protein
MSKKHFIALADEIRQYQKTAGNEWGNGQPGGAIK